MALSDAVDAPPASSWEAPRPADLNPQLWAHSRPTDATLAKLQLPDGDATYGDDGRLLAWRSAPGVLPKPGELWLRCARQFPDTGLWPLCWSSWRADLPSERRWQAAWLDPYAVPTDVYDALNLPDRQDYLIDPWDGPDEIRALLELAGLNDTSMTLAKRASWPPDPLGQLSAPEESKHLIRLAAGEPGELTLVACRRPADAVLLRDFGVANDDAPPGIFTGVLRSWETRFGVVPVTLDPAWTSFQVIAPPTGEAEVERLATEVVCFAMDSAAQGGFHIFDEDNNVSPQELVRSRAWKIWWD